MIKLDWKTHRTLMLIFAGLSALLFSGFIESFSVGKVMFDLIPTIWIGVAMQVYIIWAMWVYFR